MLQTRTRGLSIALTMFATVAMAAAALRSSHATTATPASASSAHLGDGKPPVPSKPSSTDPIRVGSVWRGSWQGTDGKSGLIVLMITQRDGSSFEAAEMQPFYDEKQRKARYGLLKCEGSIAKDKVTLKRIASLTEDPLLGESLWEMELKKDAMQGSWEWADSKANKSEIGTLILKLAK